MRIVIFNWRTRKSTLFKRFDYLSDAVDFAKKINKKSQVQKKNIVEIDPKNNKWDIIFATEDLEHMVDPESLNAKLLKLFSINGTLIITVADERKDQLEAFQYNEDNKFYVNHINFWSSESFGIFMNKLLGRKAITGVIEDRKSNLNNKLISIIHATN